MTDERALLTCKQMFTAGSLPEKLLGCGACAEDSFPGKSQ